MILETVIMMLETGPRDFDHGVGDEDGARESGKERGVPSQREIASGLQFQPHSHVSFCISFSFCTGSSASIFYTSHSWCASASVPS